MSSIQVGVRCRPFTLDDKLGVHMIQNSESEGEINLINSDYTTKRFAFSYSWWTAPNWKVHCQDSNDDRSICESMHVTSQMEVYQACGPKIREELYNGHAIVLFAYGLSGSGKTFTVFGMDAVDNSESWFYQPKPHDSWGLFPNLAYQLFQDKGDGWKITMKYFQNVVDIVRDLMSPTCEERSYQQGMKKDDDGFMDITWCKSVQVNTWEELTQAFLKANAKKAIAPTQFNHQSTRGHCIMVLDVIMPDKDDPSMKKRGRVYVCDLAGTEPAGDIYHALYENKKMSDGTVEKHLVGPHPDTKKTKELQDQGKKINLSLSEMAQFFMKMAEAFKKKKLKPGVSIPGCNSYFLCKFLKDTLLQSKTYLFCAVRPEVTYLKYTFATLGFAKNASVVQLAPKKATTAATPAERKLMEQLEQMKLKYAELEAKKAADPLDDEHTSADGSDGGDGGGGGGGGGGGSGGGEAAKLKAELEAARAALQSHVSAESAEEEARHEEALQKQAAQYAKRGITLAELESNCQQPHFVNLDEDSFRSSRFLYILKGGGAQPTAFGPKCDISPPSFSVKRDHCFVEPNGEGSFWLVGGKGETVLKGRPIKSGEKAILSQYDWVSMGTEVMIFRMPGWSPAEQPAAEELLEEVQEAMAKLAEGDSGDGSGGDEDDEEVQMQIAQLEQTNTNLHATKSRHRRASRIEQLPQKVDQKAIFKMYKRCADVEELCRDLDRDLFTFEPAMVHSVDSNDIKVAVKVTSKTSTQEIVLQESDFISCASLLSDEKFKLLMALENDDEYTVSDAHDPIAVLYDYNCFHLGTTVLFPEHLIYTLETDPEDASAKLRQAVAPYEPVGHLEMAWLPLGSEDEDAGVDPLVIDDPADLLGKPWTGKLTIKQAVDLPVMVDQAYVHYEWWGADGQEMFTTENVTDQVTHSPAWHYTRIHHVPVVTQEFIDFLSRQWHVHLFVSPYIKVEGARPISTQNTAVRAALLPEIELAGGTDDGPGDLKDARIAELEAELEALRLQLNTPSKLRARLDELEDMEMIDEYSDSDGDSDA